MKFASIADAGWIGALLVLVAYSLLSFGAFTPHDSRYQLLNALGAAGIVVSAIRKHDYPPVLLNLVWLAVALIVLAGSTFGR